MSCSKNSKPGDAFIQVFKSAFADDEGEILPVIFFIVNVDYCYITKYVIVRHGGIVEIVCDAEVPLNYFNEYRSWTSQIHKL